MVYKILAVFYSDLGEYENALAAIDNAFDEHRTNQTSIQAIDPEFTEAYALKAEIFARTHRSKSQRKKFFAYLLDKYKHACHKPNAFGFLNEAREPATVAYEKLKARLDYLAAASHISEETPLAQLLL